MQRKHGFTLIELLLSLCIISIISSAMAAGITSYFKTKNKYEAMFTQNCILGVISNAKQYCREKNKYGDVVFDLPSNEVYFISDFSIKDRFYLPKNIKLVGVSNYNKKLEVNNRGIISGDACTITLKDLSGNLYYITVCVGSFYVEIK